MNVTCKKGHDWVVTLYNVDEEDDIYEKVSKNCPYCKAEKLEKELADLKKENEKLRLRNNELSEKFNDFCRLIQKMEIDITKAEQRGGSFNYWYIKYGMTVNAIWGILFEIYISNPTNIDTDVIFSRIIELKTYMLQLQKLEEEIKNRRFSEIKCSFCGLPLLKEENELWNGNSVCNYCLPNLLEEEEEEY